MSKIIQKRVIVWFIAIIVSIFVSGCGTGEDPILGQSANIAAPTIVAVTPEKDDTNVSYVLKSVTAEFSIPMDLATLTTATFTLLDENNVTAAVSGVSYANKVAELALSADLLPNTVYTATITTGAKSSDGIALLNNYVWKFTTGSIPDTTKPTVFSTSPRNGDINISITKLITATFSEAMLASSITAPLTFSVMETNTSFNVDGNISYSVINKVASFKPTSDLVADTNYTATITTVAKDLAGNAMLNNYNWTFVTGSIVNTTPPTVVATNPDNADINVSYALKKVTAEFSIPMDLATLTTTTFTLLDDNNVTAPISGVSYANKVAELALSADLDANTTYTATISTGAKSEDGIALLNNYVWTFTTGPIPDTTRPTVFSTSPKNGDINISITKLITATFSEAMIPSSITAPLTFSVMETNSSLNVNGAVTYSVINKTATFEPNANLAADTNYTATITTVAKDLAGNAMLNDYNWTFVTAIAPPRVVAVVPVNNEINVSITIKSITAEFNVAMAAATLTTTSFTLLDENNVTAPVAGVSYANKVAELNTTANLLPDTVYTATITTDAKSLDGIALLNNYVWKFTTGTIPDTTPPEVNATSPRDGDINVSITKLITATFSEAMIPSSITATGPSTFSVMETNTSLNVDGNVSYAVINKIASFKPTLNLKEDTNYTATITTVAKDLADNAMLNDYNWTFVTAAAIIIPPELVPLGLASTYGIAATAGVTNTLTFPNTQIDGDVVLNPLDQCNAVTVDNAGGFGICGGAAPSINGTVVTPTYPDTTTAQNVTADLRAAYLSITPANMPGGTSIAAGTTLGAPTGNALVEGDNLFYTGVYTSNTSILITGDLTLDAQGDPDATFVFQSASTVGTMPNARILLVNGAKASNVWWQAGSDATLQTNTTWNGNILAYRDVSMVTGASSCGRLFAGAFTDGAFVFDSNHVSVPGNPSGPVDCK